LALIADETIHEVKRALDITEVVGGYLQLKKAGANYKALCPFHEEKTPSFNVHPERQIFHCFGCHKGGDVISFVMEYEKVDYPEAIRILADRAGIEVKYSGEGPQGIGRKELYHANEWAAGVFRGWLQRAPEAEAARGFLVRRGVNDETAELFGLGFSMDAWDQLLNRARKAGVPDKVLASAGLAVERESKTGHYDRFRGRLMFPIHDLRGKPVAFGARTLKDEVPKFINSPETALFSKGRGFYGLHLAKEELEKTKTVYIVEGYLDVIVPYQVGVRGLVATLGTALTKDHLKVLRRYADKVVLVFDSDAAGQKASERGLDLLLSENMDLFVAELPPGMDPDDVVVKQGPDALRACLEKPREIFEFLVTSLTARHGQETPAARARVVGEMLDRVRLVPDRVKQEILVLELSRRFGIEEQTLRAQLGRGPEAPATVAVPATADSIEESAARDLIACLAADRAVAAQVRAGAPLDRYPDGPLRRIAETAYGLFDRTGEVVARDLVTLLREPPLVGLASAILAVEVGPGAAARATSCLAALERSSARRESSERRIRLKSASGDEEAELLRQVMEARRRRPQDHGLMPGR